MITALQNPWGFDAPYGIHPMMDQQDPRREPQAEPNRNASPADKSVSPEDRVTLSGQHLDGQHLDPSLPPTHAGRADAPQGVAGEAVARTSIPSDDKAGEDAESQAPAFGEAATDSEKSERIRDLKQRDTEVKAHEQAHMAAGGGLVQGAANYTYEKGPDGAMYAVGGEVKIDTSPARTPEQTILKAQQIRRAALAPAQPSGTDRAVAAAASQMEAQARAEKLKESAPGGQTPSSEATSPEAATPEADAREAETRKTDTRTETGPHTEAATQNTPSSPFAAPAIQAYQSAAAAIPTARAISTFA